MPLLSAASRSSCPRLLVLDGDAAVAAQVTEVGRDAGFDARAAARFDLLAATDVEMASVVVLELELEGIDGIQVLRRLALRDRPAAVVLIGAVDRRVLDAAQRLAGAHGLQIIGSFTKPVDTGRLRSLLRSFEPTAERLSAPAAPVSLSELQRALDRGEIRVYFQPKIAVPTLDFSGVEALIRWAHPGRGSVPPDTFIRLAERSGLIVQLTQHVMSRAFADCEAWRALGIVVPMAINLSPRSFEELALPDLIEQLAGEHGVPTSQVIVEITEGWREADEVSALDVLTRLRLKGFELSIDDFGTGYSSMLQLKRNPFNELKLSGSFIHGAAADREARVILESSVSLGRQLGLRVVAEGIERQEDWDLVAGLGCDEAQGYFLARAMRADALPRWLERWNRMLDR
jgi:EAL domain-containing protein (putative c-di-GMP-specific phosphodiesterase class I)/FixJ family two-component response regulator